MVRRRALAGLLALLVSAAAHAQQPPWSGILAPSRAMDWSKAGVSGSIPSASWAKCGPTIAAYGFSGAPGDVGTINGAIAACPAQTYVQLGAGTFYLNSGIVIESQNDVEVRGMGANSTFLVFSDADPCQGTYAAICFESQDINWNGGPSNGPVDWTAGSYAPGTTTLTLASVPNLVVGNPLILDQLDSSSDNGGVLVAAATVNGNPFTAPGSPGPYSLQGDNGEANRPGRGQLQIVTVTGCGGVTTPGATCAGTNVSVTISPGLYMPTWSAGSSPQAWWASLPVHNAGVQNLSIDTSAISWPPGAGVTIDFFNTVNGWVRGVRTLDGSRSAVQAYYSAHLTVRDNYFFLARNSTSTSYGFECFTSTDDLVENNIFQAMAGLLTINGSCEGAVLGYNYATLQFYTSSSGWMMPMSNSHGINTDLDLYEGNVGSQVNGDVFHGSHNLDTLFRNYFAGNLPACWLSGSGYATSSYGACTSDQLPISLLSFSRFFNIVGNVLGSPGVQTAYDTGFAPIYGLGGGDTDPNTNVTVPDDPVVAQTLMRWGNYDTVNGSVQWNGAEVPSGLAGAQAPFANPVPSSQTLPQSFYYAGQPAWWPAGKAWPPIGPDVAGGNIPGLGGYANTNPAEDCFLASGGAANGFNATPIAFDADVCYGQAASTGGTTSSGASSTGGSTTAAASTAGGGTSAGGTTTAGTSAGSVAGSSTAGSAAGTTTAGSSAGSSTSAAGSSAGATSSGLSGGGSSAGTTTAGRGAASSSSGSSGGKGSSGGSVAGASSTSAGNPDGGGSSSAVGGCGCRTGASDQGPPSLVLAVAMWAFARSRLRRRSELRTCSDRAR